MRQYLACDSTRSNWLRHWAKPTKRQSIHRSGASTRHGLDAPLCFNYFGLSAAPVRRAASQLLARRVAAATRAARSSAYTGVERTPAHQSIVPKPSQGLPGKNSRRSATRRLPRARRPGTYPPRLMNSASRPSDSTSASRALSAGTQLGSPTLARSASSGYSLSCSATLTPRMYW